jgi:hypothetical protein
MRLATGVNRIAHTAKLDHLKWLAVQPRANLAEEHWRSHLVPDHQRNDNQGRREKEQAYTSAQKIQSALHQFVNLQHYERSINRTKSLLHNLTLHFNRGGQHALPTQKLLPETLLLLLKRRRQARSWNAAVMVILSRSKASVSDSRSIQTYGRQY